MARTPEGKIKDWLKKEMDTKYPNRWEYAPPGGAFGKAGTPDRLYCIGGLFIAIEVKIAGARPSELQMAQLKRIAQFGGIAAWIGGKDAKKLKLIFSVIDSKLERLSRAYEQDLYTDN